MPMRIHNFRVGFATNSSSSHSVILIPPSAIGQVQSLPSDSECYGWDWFMLVTEEEKLRYLAAQLFAQYLQDKDAVGDILRQIGGVAPELAQELECARTADNTWDSGVPSVDHQSVWALGHVYQSALTGDLIEWARSPRIVVRGGNDNEFGHGDTLPGVEIRAFNDLRDKPPHKAGDGNRMRSHVNGSVYTIFDTHTGVKTRLDFSNEELLADNALIRKSQAPELVDLKITNWCDAECRFCYQASTRKGKHAPLPRLLEVIDLLAGMETFEIAIGGGEPTAHPDFDRLLQAIAAKGIVPNFTTYTDRWLDTPSTLQAVSAFVGGVGVSCHSVADLDRVKRVRRALNTGSRKNRNSSVTAQHVFGAVPMDETVAFLNAAFSCRIPVLLLGYKEVGFGKSHVRHDGPGSEVYIKLGLEAHVGVALSVDTALVDRFPNLPRLLGAPEALVTSPEGKFSCYIDAVDGRMGASSYLPVRSMDKLTLIPDEFRARYATY